MVGCGRLFLTLAISAYTFVAFHKIMQRFAALSTRPRLAHRVFLTLCLGHFLRTIGCCGRFVLATRPFDQAGVWARLSPAPHLQPEEAPWVRNGAFLAASGAMPMLVDVAPDPMVGPLCRMACLLGRLPNLGLGRLCPVLFSLHMLVFGKMLFGRTTPPEERLFRTCGTASICTTFSLAVPTRVHGTSSVCTYHRDGLQPNRIPLEFRRFRRRRDAVPHRSKVRAQMGNGTSGPGRPPLIIALAVESKPRPIIDARPLNARAKKIQISMDTVVSRVASVASGGVLSGVPR